MKVVNKWDFARGALNLIQGALRLKKSRDPPS